MKLQRREKILAGVALGLAGLPGLWFLFFTGDGRSDEDLRTERAKLTSEKQSKTNLLDKASKDAKRLAQWQQQSLPSDPVLARSLYQNWLRSLAARANLHGTTLAATDAGGGRHDQFAKISFTLNAQANLGDLVQFLYDFYSAGFLHQIRDMTIKPLQSARELEVKLKIEALSLPAADSKDRLPEAAGHVLRLAQLPDYREPIVSRDFFAAYVRPAPPPPRRRENTVDPADSTFVTGFIEGDGEPLVWIEDRMADKTWKLKIGEGFTVAGAKGRVQSIRADEEATVDFDGHRRVLRLGDNLHGGVEIPDPQRKPPEEGRFRAFRRRSRQLIAVVGTI